MPDDAPTIETINDKLDTIIGLLATSGKDEDEKIRILAGLGFSWTKIGALTGLKASTARMRVQGKSKKKT